MTYAQCLERLVILSHDYRSDEGVHLSDAVLQQACGLLGIYPLLVQSDPTITCSPEGTLIFRWTRDGYHYCYEMDGSKSAGPATGSIAQGRLTAKREE